MVQTDKGLGNHTYLYSVAVNSDNPYNIIVSAASNAWKSHAIQDLETFIYRRDSGEENQEWILSNNGLPESKGTVISILQLIPRSGMNSIV